MAARGRGLTARRGRTEEARTKEEGEGERTREEGDN